MGMTKQLSMVVLDAIQRQQGTRFQVFKSCEEEFGNGWEAFKRILRLLISEGLVEVNTGPDPFIALSSIGIAMVDPVEPLEDIDIDLSNEKIWR